MSGWAGVRRTPPWSAPPELALISTIPVGDAPAGAEMADHDRLCLVVSTRTAANLSFISLADRKEIARIPVGKGAKHIAVAQVPKAVIDAFEAVAR